MFGSTKRKKRKLPKKPKAPKESASIETWKRYGERVKAWEAKVKAKTEPLKKKKALINQIRSAASRVKAA
ncbi:hypothetical protein CH361_12070 [Leptospira brenneri]|nr:hypothetical protein CH361_12070 [Leptospira brenneri]